MAYTAASVSIGGLLASVGMAIDGSAHCHDHAPPAQGRLHCCAYTPKPKPPMAFDTLDVSEGVNVAPAPAPAPALAADGNTLLKAVGVAAAGGVRDGAIRLPKSASTSSTPLFIHEA